jgi:hypothetical protein
VEELIKRDGESKEEKRRTKGRIREELYTKKIGKARREERTK